MSLSKKVKVALDETRTLILGAQILLGFQLQGVFRPVFDRLPWHDRYLDIASLLFSSLTVGLLIAPSLHHQIVDEGDSTRRIHRTIGRFASWALAPFAPPPHPPPLGPVRRLGSGPLCHRPRRRRAHGCRARGGPVGRDRCRDLVRR